MSIGTLVPSKRIAVPRTLGADRFLGDFFNDFWTRPNTPATSEASRFVPSLDVAETENEYRVTAELPGLGKDDFEVVVEDGVLTLKGEKRRQETSEEAGRCRTEISYGSFERRIRFGDAISEDEVAASFKNGVLVITLPKPEEARPQVRSVPVQTH